MPPAGRRDVWNACVPGPSADLGATLSVGRLAERWEKADSERQMSEEEKSRRLAQGWWKKNLSKATRKSFALKANIELL